MSAAVPSADLARSIDFYTRGLGLNVATRLETPGASEVVLAFPGGGANLILLKPKTADAPPAPVRSAVKRAVIAVPDLEALQARLAAAGYALEGPIVRQPKFHVAVANVADPDGNAIELVQGGR